jgi:hypothetical protein
MTQKPKVPLSIGWLSENELLEPAAKLLGYEIKPKTADSTGINAVDQNGGLIFLNWEDDSFTFTLAQLQALGFDPGDEPEPDLVNCLVWFMLHGVHCGGHH